MAQDKPVRVRFAPSPTGYLHVGGARTAIYNYFFAKATGGTFYLRIEDTDRKRYNEEALKDLMRDLKWLGLQWDEGPGCEGGCGPYFQSERLDIYHREIQKLLDSGDAYYCFCTEERLQEVRAAQEKAGVSVTGYDRHCRNISREEAEARIAAGEKAVIRFKVPETGVTEFDDMIRGHIEYQNELLDDLVLIKRDGYPTYHFASVVDDHLMGTTHVLRGDEWISSTPKHMLLYKAFGWEPPKWVHLPVILDKNGGKLSKRKGAASVGDFRDLGYLPETLVNYLALLGWNPGDDREVMTVKEMVDCFTLERINPKSASFDEKKLQWMNGQHIHQCDDEFLAGFMMEGLKAKGINVDGEPKERIAEIVKLLKPRAHFMQDLADQSVYFFVAPATYDEKGKSKQWGPGSKEIASAVRNALANVETFTTPNIEKAFMDLTVSRGCKLGDLVGAVRLAVSGVTAGPGLWELFEVVGKEETLRRIDVALPMMG
ncbi:MAG: glutamate--tRNA ligase [Fibrobacteraceae bacterium]|nr:glutamate--tRNA ligase [Fibrobacteraceae bacterium]